MITKQIDNLNTLIACLLVHCHKQHPVPVYLPGVNDYNSLRTSAIFTADKAKTTDFRKPIAASSPYRTSGFKQKFAINETCVCPFLSTPVIVRVGVRGIMLSHSTLLDAELPN